MKTLVISPQPFFSPRGTPFSVYYRTLVTAELGVEVDLLTYGEGQDVDIPGVRIIRIPRFAFLGNVPVGPSILKLFLDVFILFWTVGLLLRNRYDFVHAHEEAVFFCSFLKPFFGFKLVYDMHSSLPQQLTNFQFTKSEFLIRLFKRLEDVSIHAADAVITICPDLEEYVNGLIGSREKNFLIENSIFDPVKTVSGTLDSTCASGVSDCQVKPLELPQGKRFVVYAGTLEPYQGIDYLIAAFFTGRVPQFLAKHYCSLAAVLVSPRSEGSNTPLKIYEQLASGIPLVATNIYSHTQVLDGNVAFLVQPDPGDMALGILVALEVNGDRHRIAANARELYELKYSRQVYEEKIRRLLEFLF
jgi:glycosyltransferase involved in cell wall biosynthesis